MAKKKLSEYRAKRDFKKTRSPPAKPRYAVRSIRASSSRSMTRRACTTTSASSIDGVFKSWAVTKGPSLDPHDKRLAVEVEDHPLDYGDFEGTIPKGEYGGGTVMVWDRGFWMPGGNESAAEQLREGELKFVLAGQKLKGSWVLVRMKGDRFGGKRTNWLLIKHRDEWAKDGDDDKLLNKDRSAASGRTMGQIARGEGKAPEASCCRSRGRSSPNPTRSGTRANPRSRRVRLLTRPARARRPSSPASRKARGGRALLRLLIAQALHHGQVMLERSRCGWECARTPRGRRCRQDGCAVRGGDVGNTIWRVAPALPKQALVQPVR